MQTKFSEKELEFRLNNDLTNVEVFKKLFLENRLYILNEKRTYEDLKFLNKPENLNCWKIFTKILDSTIVKDFILYVKVLNEIYPNQWDFNYIIEDNKILIYGFHIKFDKFKINNNTGFSHTIENLITTIFIFYSFQFSQIKLYNTLCGNRTTLTESEYKANYLHSHLCCSTDKAFTEPKKDFNYSSEFCLGYSKLKELLNYQFKNRVEDTEKIFRNILLNIYSTISYESLEGSPYRNISKIYKGSNYIVAGNFYISDESTTLCKHLFYKIIEEKLSFNVYFTDNSIRVNIPPESEKKLVEYVLQNPSYRNFGVICFKGSGGNTYIYEERDSNSLPQETNLYTIFKGKKLFFEIKKDENNDNNKLQKDLFLRQEIKNFINLQIERYLNESLYSPNSITTNSNTNNTNLH